MNNRTKRKHVKVTRYGIVHHHAVCTDPECSWYEGIHTDVTPTAQSLRNAVRRHVRTTGHRVTIETGTSTDYTLEDDAQT